MSGKFQKAIFVARIVGRVSLDVVKVIFPLPGVLCIAKFRQLRLSVEGCKKIIHLQNAIVICTLRIIAKAYCYNSTIAFLCLLIIFHLRSLTIDSHQQEGNNDLRSRNGVSGKHYPTRKKQ